MATWHDIESVREEWLDAPESDDLLEELVEVAQQSVVAYAPKLVEPEDEETEQVIPTNYRYAQLQQVKNLWNAGRVDSSGGVGDDGFVFRPHPLDWVIKQILRPRRAVPRVR
ncbi:Head-to-tail adaptor [Salinibacterium sp. NYA9b]